MAATAYTLTNASSNLGYPGYPSTNFQVKLNGVPGSAVTITPDDASDGGTFTPSTLVISDAMVNTFTYTPGSKGFKTISTTNDSGLTDPAAVPFTVNPNTLGLVPALLPRNHVTKVTFVGGGTSWLGSAPTFTPSVVSGISVGAVTVLSNEQATAFVTTGNNAGNALFTDSTTSIAATVPIGAPGSMPMTSYVGPTRQPRVKMTTFRSLKRS